MDAGVGGREPCVRVIPAKQRSYTTMAVIVMMEMKGMTQHQYDQANAMMGGKVPPGCLVHTASVMAGGMQMVDVWESEAAYEKFAQETLSKMGAAIGLTSQPEVKMHPVHNFMHA